MLPPQCFHSYETYDDMDRVTKASESSKWNAELDLLGSLRWSRREFVDRICAASRSREEKVRSIFRLEASYKLAEFYFLLKARGIEAVTDVQKLADLHNQYVVDVIKD